MKRLDARRLSPGDVVVCRRSGSRVVVDTVTERGGRGTKMVVIEGHQEADNHYRTLWHTEVRLPEPEAARR